MHKANHIRSLLKCSYTTGKTTSCLATKKKTRPKKENKDKEQIILSLSPIYLCVCIHIHTYICNSGKQLSISE